MNNPAYFEIQASDLGKTIHFYTEIFGWKFIKEEGLPIEYYRIETEGVRGGLLKRPANIPPQECGTNSFTCSMMVENYDASAQKIMTHGGIVVMSKFAVPGKCWQGYFMDIDNNVFGIFQVDEHAR